MKRGRVVFSVVILLCFLSSMALANGLNLNSIGTRALAMGGAFVGLADDFSAIYWNPAGIAHFKQKHFGFYATDIIPSSTYKLEPDIPGIGTFRLIKADTVSKHYLSGLAAYYFPVSEKVVAGIGVYIPSGLGASWDGADFAAIANNNPSLDWRSKIGLITISPALAFKVNDNIFVGATLNINYGKFDIAMHGGATDAPLPVVDLGQYEESMTGWGYGATLGVLVKPTDKLSIGATFRTASTVKFDGDASLTGMSDLGLALGTSLNQTSNLNREVTWPMWFATGVSFKPIEELTLTGDVQWTQWSVIDTLETNYLDPDWKNMMGASGDDKRPMNWEDALQIRFGAEYRIKNFAFRGGYYIDPSPAPAQTMNVLLPNYDFNVVTIGFGYALNGIQFDFGLEYLMGKERSVPFDVVPIATLPYFEIQMPSGFETAMPGTYTMKIIVPTLSVSYRF